MCLKSRVGAYSRLACWGVINVFVVNSSGCLTFRVDLFHEQEQVLEGEEEEAGRERRAHARHHDGRAGTDRRRRRLRERVRDQKGIGRAINLTMTRGNRHTFLYLTPEQSSMTGPRPAP